MAGVFLPRGAKICTNRLSLKVVHEGFRYYLTPISNMSIIIKQNLLQQLCIFCYINTYIYHQHSYMSPYNSPSIDHFIICLEHTVATYFVICVSRWWVFISRWHWSCSVLFADSQWYCWSSPPSLILHGK